VEISEILSSPGCVGVEGCWRGRVPRWENGRGRKEAKNTIRRKRNNEIPIDA